LGHEGELERKIFGPATFRMCGTTQGWRPAEAILPRGCGIPQARGVREAESAPHAREIFNFELGRRDGFEPAHQG